MQRSMSVRKRVLFLFIMVKFLGCENTKKLPNPRNPKKKSIFAIGIIKPIFATLFYHEKKNNPAFILYMRAISCHPGPVHAH